MADLVPREPDVLRQARETRVESARLRDEAGAIQQQAALLRITAKRVVGEAVVLMLEGALEMASVPAVLEELEACSDGVTPVRIDLSGVDFMDSTGLNLLLGLTAGTGPAKRSLSLVRPSEAVMRVVRITGTGERLGLGHSR
jgi:anti-sigma B factor antagonist